MRQLPVFKLLLFLLVCFVAVWCCYLELTWLLSQQGYTLTEPVYLCLNYMLITRTSLSADQQSELWRVLSAYRFVLCSAAAAAAARCACYALPLLRPLSSRVSRLLPPFKATNVRR